MKRIGISLAAAALAAVTPSSVLAQTDQKQSTTTAPSAVSINTIEENAAKYVGKTVKVTGEVDEVLGPRMFKIDEREWLDFDGETLVFLPAPLAAFVSEGEPVTVTGTLRTVMDVDLKKEWGWFELEPDIEAELNKRNVIVATTVTTREGVNLALRMTEPMATPVGTSGTSNAALTDVAMLAGSNDETLVGRTVHLQNVKLGSIARDGGFWVNAGSQALFILPAQADLMKVYPGDTVSIRGVVMEMPEAMNDRVADRKVASSEEIYIYATEVKR